MSRVAKLAVLAADPYEWTLSGTYLHRSIRELGLLRVRRLDRRVGCVYRERQKSTSRSAGMAYRRRENAAEDARVTRRPCVCWRPGLVGFPHERLPPSTASKSPPSNEKSAP